MLSKRILVLMFLVLFLPLVGCFPQPVNQAPIITSSPVTTATVGVLYAYDVNATDPDGDTLTYLLVTKPKGMAMYPKTGVINWTPTSAQLGNNQVSVKVSDGTLSVIQNFTIKVGTLPAVNQAPVIYSTPVTTATVGLTYFYDVNATDPNGDILTYSLTAYPSGMAISSASGLIMWTPVTAQVGNNLVTVMVSDGTLIDIQSFTIVVSKPTVPLETYTITASAGTGGTISPLGDVTVNKGANIVFNITPNTNYNIADVLVDGGSVGAVAFYTFTNVAKDHTIHATFSTVEPEPEPELSDNADLSALSVSLGILTPNFLEATTEYNVSVAHDIATVSVTATLADTKASMTIDGTTQANGVAKTVTLGLVGTATKINIKVTAEDGTTKTYTITVNRAEPPAKLISLTESLVADFEPKFIPEVYEYSLVATHNEDTITLEAIAEDGTTIKYDYKYEYPRKGMETGNFSLLVGKNIITIIVEKDGYQTTTYTITVTRETILPVHNVSIDAYYETIQSAIANASDGHTIYVAAGTYSGNVTIDKSLTLLGAQAGECAIGRTSDEAEIVGGITVNSGVSDFTIDGFKITGGGAFMHIESASATVMNNIIVKEPGACPTNYVYLNGVSMADIRCNDFSGEYCDVRRPNVFQLTTANDASTVTIANNEMHDVGGGGGIAITGNGAGAVIEIIDNVIDNTGDCIWTFGPAFGTLLITGNNLVNCHDSGLGGTGSYIGVKVAGGVTGDVQIHDNNIEKNKDEGVFNDSSNDVVDATNNWWGHTSGPYNLSTNPGGLGNAVSDNVDFDPWTH